MVEKKEPNEEIGKRKIEETLRAYIASKEESKANDPGTPMTFIPEIRGEGKVDVEPVEAADAKVLQFAQTLKRKAGSSQVPAGSLDAIALKLLEILFAQEPAWEERDRDLAQEWGLSPAERVLKCCALVYDQQLHMNMVHGYEFLEAGAKSVGQPETSLMARMEAECPQCHKTFTRKVPGQICCSNECGDAYFPKPERKEPVFDDNFERFIESQNNPNRVPPVDPIRGPGMPVSGVVR